jgi:hypothetical protein
LTGATFGLAASIGIGAKAASMGSKVVSALSKTISAGKGVISKAVSYGCKAINAVKTVANKAVGKVGDVMESARDSLKALGKHIQRSWNRLVGSGEGTGAQWAERGFDVSKKGMRSARDYFESVDELLGTKAGNLIQSSRASYYKLAIRLAMEELGKHWFIETSRQWADKSNSEVPSYV